MDGDSTSFVVTNAFAGRNRINVVAHADKYEDSTSASAYVYVPDEIISANAKYTSDNEILLSIDFTIGGEADGFVIYQSTNGSEFTKIGDTKGLINSYTVKGVSKSNKYDFKIIPYCENEFILYGKAYKLTVNSQTSDNKDSDSSDLTEEIPQKGQQIKDKKYIYKVTKAGNKNALGELSVTGLKKTSLKVVKIAAKVTIGGISYKVTYVDKKAFKNNKKITKVFIGKNVQSIGVNAFRGCKKLSAVSINSTVLKTIGKNAFYNCKKLKKVIIKSSKLTKIGKAAFKEIKKKAVFKVPKSKKNKYKKMIEKAGAKNPKVK